MATEILQVNSSRFFGTDLSNVLKDKNLNNVISRQNLLKKKTKLPIKKYEPRLTNRKLFITDGETKQLKIEEINAKVEDFPPQIEKTLELMVEKLIADENSTVLTPVKPILKYDREFLLKFKDCNIKPIGMTLLPEITRKPGTEQPIPLQQVWLPKPQTEGFKKIPKSKEDDGHRLQQREKQIEFGKNTDGYKRYREDVPKKRRTRDEPQTPDKYQKCSKRSWDGQIRKWRRLLHKYDKNAKEGEIDFDIENTEDITEMDVIDELQELNLKTNDEVLLVDM